MVFGKSDNLLESKKKTLEELDLKITDSRGQLALIQSDFSAYQKKVGEIKQETEGLLAVIGFLKDVKEAKDVYATLLSNIELAKEDLQKIENTKIEVIQYIEKTKEESNTFVEENKKDIAIAKNECETYVLSKIAEIKNVNEQSNNIYNNLIIFKKELEAKDIALKERESIVDKKEASIDNKLSIYESKLIEGRRIYEETKTIKEQTQSLLDENIIKVGEINKKEVSLKELNDKCNHSISLIQENARYCEGKLLEANEILNKAEKIYADNDEILKSIIIEQDKVQAMGKDLDEKIKLNNMRESEIKGREILVIEGELKNKEDLSYINRQKREYNIK